MKRVLIVSETLPHYRVALHNKLGPALASSGIELRVAYGQPSGAAALKGDVGALPEFGLRITNRYLSIGPWSFCWQPALRHAVDADLVIVAQANRLLVNYPLMLLQMLGWKRVAFWGHGRNFQSRSSGALRERIKRLICRLPHWWFAYNDLSRRVVQSCGYPPDRITDLQNAVDTSALAAAARATSPEDIERLRGDYGLSRECVVYVGGMYPEKRLGFLIEALDYARADKPGLSALFVGGGPDADLIVAAARTRSWMRYVGPRFADDLVRHALMGRLMVMPGLVGLAVLDSFALEIPMVTTRVTFHSPEIDYLRHGENGVIVEDPDDVEAYAATIVRLLNDPETLGRLRAGCAAARDVFTIDEMCRRFHDGVVAALERPGRRA